MKLEASKTVGIQKKSTKAAETQLLVSDEERMPVAKWEQGGAKSEAKAVPAANAVPVPISVAVPIAQPAPMAPAAQTAPPAKQSLANSGSTVEPLAQTASFKRRVAAGSIDFIIVFIVSNFAMVLLGTILMMYLAVPTAIVPLLNQNHIGVLLFPSMALMLAPCWLPIAYQACFEYSSLQATPGNWMMRLYVSDKTGGPVSWWKTLLRIVLLEVAVMTVSAVSAIVFGLIAGLLLPSSWATLVALSLSLTADVIIFAILLCLPIVGVKKQALLDVLIGRYVLDKNSIDEKTWKEGYAAWKQKKKNKPAIIRWTLRAIAGTMIAAATVSTLALLYVNGVIWSHYPAADRLLNQAYVADRSGDAAKAGALIAQAKKSDMLAFGPLFIIGNLDNFTQLVKDPDPVVAYKSRALVAEDSRWLMEAKARGIILTRHQVSLAAPLLAAKLSHKSLDEHLLDRERNEFIKTAKLALQSYSQNLTRKDSTAKFLGGSELEGLCAQLEYANDKKDADYWRARLKKESSAYRKYLKEAATESESHSKK
jgi:hypothetical protein